MKIYFALIMLALLMPKSSFAIPVSDYLIDTDIGEYSRSYPGACPEGSGIVAGVDHFMVDHIDYACDIRYYKKIARLGVEVQVTQHAGADSHNWLLHEVEIGYRDSSSEKLGLLHKGAYIEKINNNIVMRLEIAGGSYRWISNNNVVVSIKYRDPDFAKSEPLEVVKAYLAKYPSIIPATFKLNRDHEVAWLKDEMERRLWLGDKWFAQIQTADPKLRDKLKSMTDSMVVFLNYREKYFGISAKDEKISLETALFQNNVTAVQTKLTEYKTWWTAHKSDSITLP